MLEQKKAWTEVYKNEYEKNGMTFPSEYVIRMFKGVYPKCNLKQLCGGSYSGKSILDISCGGDGRDLIVFDQVGFSKISATELTSEIVAQVKGCMDKFGINVDVRTGTNRNLPFEDENFDFLLSWNVCYYFDDVLDFDLHVKEYARVLKKGGVLVFSIPKRNCFIYKNGIEKSDGLIEITSDPWEIRNGILLKSFKNEEEIKKAFETFFTDFTFGSIEDDCFGLDYSWHIGYCIKK